MKRFSLLLIASMATMALSAQSFTEWHDAEVNEINRAPMHASYKIFNDTEAAAGNYCDAAYPYRLSLNGTWRFNWVENADQRPTDFFSLGYNDAAWDKMEVPAMWELNGYGDPVYVNVGYAWRGNFRNEPPKVPNEQNHVGSYRREVEIPTEWSGRDIMLNIGGYKGITAKLLCKINITAAAARTNKNIFNILATIDIFNGTSQFIAYMLCKFFGRNGGKGAFS